jgi:hypothetical protein
MSRFSIEFTPHAEDPMEAAMRVGVIRIGDFEERFESSTEFWSPARYESQWSEALSRLHQKSPRSCLITSITDPANANFIFWWPMYLVDQNVHFQNHALFFSDIEGSFDPDDPYRHVPQRSVTNEQGERISEWIIPFNDVVVAKTALMDVSAHILAIDNPVRS